MVQSKDEKESAKATLASVTLEMGKPRTARSARIVELNLDVERAREEPRRTMHGTVRKVIPSPHPSRKGKAQIGIEEADPGYRNLRIENTLTDEHGDEMNLKEGARVEVTVAAERETQDSERDKPSRRARRKKADYSFRKN
jgi:hypothetical protein